MTDREEFEKWYKTTNKGEVSRFEIWQARGELDAVKIKELEGNSTTTSLPIAWMWDNNGVTEYTQDVYSVEYYSKTYGVTMTPLYSIDKGQWENWSNAVAEKLCIAIDRLKDRDNKIIELTAKLDKALEDNKYSHIFYARELNK